MKYMDEGWEAEDGRWKLEGGSSKNNDLGLIHYIYTLRHLCGPCGYKY